MYEGGGDGGAHRKLHQLLELLNDEYVVGQTRGWQTLVQPAPYAFPLQVRTQGYPESTACPGAGSYFGLIQGANQKFTRQRWTESVAEGYVWTGEV
jgi:hypothetical protein